MDKVQGSTDGSETLEVKSTWGGERYNQER